MRHGHTHRGGLGGRLFDYGELRLLILAMIAGQPRYGYELIKLIEDRMGGSYTPSPGIIYPTLTWLDDMGYATPEAAEGARKRYRITPQGEAFLAANQAAAEALRSRMAEGPARMAPPPILRAMENLKLALKLRLKQGPIDQTTAECIASALDDAARFIERG